MKRLNTIAIFYQIRYLRFELAEWYRWMCMWLLLKSQLPEDQLMDYNIFQPPSISLTSSSILYMDASYSAVVVVMLRGSCKCRRRGVICVSWQPSYKSWLLPPVYIWGLSYDHYWSIIGTAQNTDFLDSSSSNSLKTLFSSSYHHCKYESRNVFDKTTQKLHLGVSPDVLLNCKYGPI